MGHEGGKETKETLQLYKNRKEGATGEKEKNELDYYWIDFRLLLLCQKQKAREMGQRRIAANNFNAVTQSR